MSESEKQQQEDRTCQACMGAGILGIVSREMAADACAPEMEGQPIPCNYCGGDGWT